ncbi:uncharacterized protein LOC131257910 [Magnolia sinica]|uniref:uncharacterized protein LOC131257910 n=1 Tax=Magnolia sinica TaxID=86752 RepID=UPI00265869E7|nr:uncharacterized protein LOC131257910 [Magnolia sinica]
MLVGNKVDKVIPAKVYNNHTSILRGLFNAGWPQNFYVESGRVVTKKEGIDFAWEYGCLFLECSAKTRINVQQCFEELVLKEPASEIHDKILFMFNNISASNMDVKAKEFTDVLKEQYYPWFAQYIVMKRASIEPKFHELYLKFLEKVNSRMLNKEIVKATYENCKVP